MMIDNIKKLKKAYCNYVLNTDYEVTEKALEYIKERILANKQEIKELIEIKQETVEYEEIVNAIREETNQETKYKKYKRMYINQNKFISTNLLMPIGTIAIEAFDTIEVIKYFIKAIKSRNAIAISDVEYDEQSVKFLILEIIKEALKKFNIDENLIMILPYEECFYKYFDKVIYTYDKQGEELDANQYEMLEVDDKKYIYIESNELKEVALAENEGEKEILYGELEEVVEKINSSYSKVGIIYTKNPDTAYKFINLIHSANVFVNASLQNEKQPIKSSDEMYEYKNIILPIPQEIQNEIQNEIETEKKDEWLVVKNNDSIFDKIRRFFWRLFK